MLPAIIDRNEDFQIILDDTRGFHALLVVADELGGSKPIVPLWVGTCLDRGTLCALTRWLGFRRDQWQRLGRLAECIGEKAFAQHMHAMMVAEPLEHVLGATITLHADSRELTIGEQLQGGSGMRSEPIYRHRFASAVMRDRFVRWLQASNDFPVLERLVQLAYSEGTKALGLELDRLAAAPVAAAKRRKGRTLTAA